MEEKLKAYFPWFVAAAVLFLLIALVIVGLLCNRGISANRASTERLAIDAYSEDTDEGNNDSQNDASANNLDQQLPSKTDLLAILLSKITRCQRKFPGILKENRTAQVREANGSVASIIDWAKAVNLDSRQRRAFEIIAGTFVLSFYRIARISILLDQKP